MMSAVVLSACTSTKYAAQQKKDYNDDVYYSKAKAADQVDYADNRSYRNDGYYDDYAGRINRFNSYSPFAYDSYMYSPYSYYGAAGLGLGLGYGLGYYSPYSFYSPYSYLGTGYYGVGGYPYWGLYSGYGTVSAGNYSARPNRGNGNPNTIYSRSYNPSSRGTAIIPNRGGYSSATRTSSANNSGINYNQRPARQYVPQTQRSYPTYNAPASSMGGGFSGGGGGRVSSGARPR